MGLKQKELVMIVLVTDSEKMKTSFPPVELVEGKQRQIIRLTYPFSFGLWIY
jgi:hypothetical protein